MSKFVLWFTFCKGISGDWGNKIALFELNLFSAFEGFRRCRFVYLAGSGMLTETAEANMLLGGFDIELESSVEVAIELKLGRFVVQYL